MAGYRLVVLTLCVWACALAHVAPAQNRRKGRLPEAGLTLEYIYGRLRVLERKFSRTVNLVTTNQDKVKSLEEKMVATAGRGVGGGGNAGGAPPGRKFSDLSACPIRAPGFFYAPALKSCYRLEPSNILVNQSEATRTCKTISPRSNLVSIETSEEQEFLRTRWMEELGIGSLVRFWTSARRNAGKWKWEGSDKDLTNTNWILSTEHNDDRFSCMGVYSNEAYSWIDVACWAPHVITCEVNL